MREEVRERASEREDKNKKKEGGQGGRRRGRMEKQQVFGRSQVREVIREKERS